MISGGTFQNNSGGAVFDASYNADISAGNGVDISLQPGTSVTISGTPSISKILLMGAAVVGGPEIVNNSGLTLNIVED